MTCCVERGQRCTSVWLADASLSGLVRPSTITIVVSVVARCFATLAPGHLVQGVCVVVCGSRGIRIVWHWSSHESWFLVIGVAVILVVLVLLMMVQSCCSKSCTAYTCCKLASMVMILVHCIGIRDEWLLRNHGVGQASGGVGSTSPWSRRNRNEWILVIVVVRKSRMLCHFCYSSILIPVVLIAVSSDKTVARSWSISVGSPALDFFTIWRQQSGRPIPVVASVPAAKKKNQDQETQRQCSQHTS
jgi:hypothetical protein